MADQSAIGSQPAAYALRPTRAYLLLATACAGGGVLTLGLDRGVTPGRETAVTLFAQAIICVLLAASYSLQQTRVIVAERIVALVLVGLLTGIPGYFFGAFGGYIVLLVLICAIAGVLSGSAGARHPALIGWATYSAVAGAQLIMGLLSAFRVIPDRSLLPFLSGNPPITHTIFAVISVQAMYLIAFLTGREFRRRYRQLADEVDDTIRTATIRETLLAEARAEYRRALAVARRALATQTPTPTSTPVPLEPGDTEVDARPNDPQPTATTTATTGASTSGVDPGSTGGTASGTATGGASTTGPSPAAGVPWQSAHRQKMRNLLWLTVAWSLIGVVLLWIIAFDRGVLLDIAYACLAGLAVVALFQRWISLRRGEETAYWLWAIVGALTAGPALVAGLHSPFGGAIGLILFVGGLFRAQQRRGRSNDRVFILLSICTAYLVAFVLVYLEVIPDAGNIPVMPAGAPWWEPVVIHLLVQASFVAAFVAGVVVDRSYESLMREAEAAARHAAHQQALLAAANAQIHRILGKEGEAIFVDQKVGPYKLERMLGRGGMGDVYRGVAVADGRRVAVKIVRRDRAADPVALALLAKEASALARVRSPHVAEVFDVGLGDGEELPFVAMEYIEGRTLHSLLEERGKLPLDELREMSIAIARGLAAVHEAGIVHRDVKPSNIMLTRSDGTARWKLVDFGVAQIHDLVGAADGVVAGTPQYMSPEQALGEQVDARADLYSLGLVIYRSLTGRPAYVGADRLEIARRAREQGPPDPRLYVQAPEDVERVLRLALAADREHRFDTATELAAALEAAFASRLEPPLRARAEGLLKRTPWSTKP